MIRFTHVINMTFYLIFDFDAINPKYFKCELGNNPFGKLHHHIRSSLISTRMNVDIFIHIGQQQRQNVAIDLALLLGCLNPHLKLATLIDILTKEDDNLT